MSACILAFETSEYRSSRWTFGLVSIFAGLLVPFIVFFVPETAFNREVALTVERGQACAAEQFLDIQTGEWVATYQTHGWGPFVSQIRLFNGRKSRENVFKILLRPFALMFHPAVLWGCLTQGTLIVFIVAVSAIIGLIFGGPPNFFTVEKVGYFYTGPFLGGMIGFIAGILIPCLLIFSWTPIGLFL